MAKAVVYCVRVLGIRVVSSGYQAGNVKKRNATRPIRNRCRQAFSSSSPRHLSVFGKLALLFLRPGARPFGVCIRMPTLEIPASDPKLFFASPFRRAGRSPATLARNQTP